jgi:hypothetical protein
MKGRTTSCALSAFLGRDEYDDCTPAPVEDEDDDEYEDESPDIPGNPLLHRSMTPLHFLAFAIFRRRSVRQNSLLLHESTLIL